MYHCGNCTCVKGDVCEIACKAAVTVCAENAETEKPARTSAKMVRAEKRMEEKAYVLLRGLYLRKEKGERKRI